MKRDVIGGKVARYSSRKIRQEHGGAMSIGAIADVKPMTRIQLTKWHERVNRKPCAEHKFYPGGTVCRRCGYIREKDYRKYQYQPPKVGSSLSILDAKLQAAVSPAVNPPTA